ncbi:MAG: M23 family peptidase, partial [Proteobacteria bacterium]|nr:M23 family peptidase [Pseudomonadota bacterium]
MTRYQFKPEDRAKVYNDFYGTLQGIEGENARRRREEFDKVQDSSIEQKKNETLLLVSPRLSMLSVTTDPAKANELRTEIRGILDQALSNPELDPKTRQTILTAVSSETLQRSFKSTDEQAKIFQLVQNHSN